MSFLARPVALQPAPVVVRWKNTNKTSTERITSAIILSVGLVFVRLSRLYALLSAGSRKLHSDLYNTASECDRLRYCCITSCGSGHLPRPTHPRYIAPVAVFFLHFPGLNS